MTATFYLIVRLVMIAIIGGSVRGLVEGNVFCTGATIICSLIYLHAAMYETMHDVINGD